jgi:hypothetical protein
MCSGLHVKYLSFFSDFNKVWNLSADSRKILKYQISRKSVESRVVSCGRTDTTKLIVAFRRTRLKTSQLMLCLGRIANFSEYLTKHITASCGQKVEMSFNPCSTLSNHWNLKRWRRSAFRPAYLTHNERASFIHYTGTWVDPKCRIERCVGDEVLRPLSGI